MRSRLGPLLCVVLACAHRGPDRAPAPSTAGGPPDLELARHASSERWTLSADRGQVVLLDVWATWCEPCRATLPKYDALSKELAGRGLRVYAVNIDEDGRLIEPYLRAASLTIPVLLDPGAQVAEKVFQISMLPTTLLFDRKGALRQRFQGAEAEQGRRVRGELEALLSEQR